MFKEVRESAVTKAIIGEYMKQWLKYAESDVIIAGTGPAGLTAARHILKVDNTVKVLLIERSIKPGGGAWQGGMLLPKMVIEYPANALLEELGVELHELDEDLYVVDSYVAAAKTITGAFDVGAKMMNSTEIVDVIYRKNIGIRGIVANWHAVSQLPDFITCVDPLAFEAKVVIDATGHHHEVARIAEKKLGLKLRSKEGAGVGGEGPMNIVEAERSTVLNTKEIYPGLIIAGMAVNGALGLPRMGPIFGAMYASGVKAAKIALEKLNGGNVKMDVSKTILELIDAN